MTVALDGTQIAVTVGGAAAIVAVLWFFFWKR